MWLYIAPPPSPSSERRSTTIGQSRKMPSNMVGGRKRLPQWSCCLLWRVGKKRFCLEEERVYQSLLSDVALSFGKDTCWCLTTFHFSGHTHRCWTTLLLLGMLTGANGCAFTAISGQYRTTRFFSKLHPPVTLSSLKGHA